MNTLHCPACGTELGHLRADDAYATMSEHIKTCLPTRRAIKITMEEVSDEERNQNT